jgi:PAS domain S-box-containing protein
MRRVRIVVLLLFSTTLFWFASGAFESWLFHGELNWRSLALPIAPHDLYFRLVTLALFLILVWSRIQTAIMRQKAGAVAPTLREQPARGRLEQRQAISYHVAGAAHQAESLADLFRYIHQELGQMMDTRNFYIALYNNKEKRLTWPYYVDESDQDASAPRGPGKSLTQHVIEQGRALLLSGQQIQALADRGEIGIYGSIPFLWLGAPLISKGQAIGLVAMQSYSSPNAYTEEDVEFLEFISTQIAAAIEHKRAESELQWSESLLRSMAENSPLAFYVIDMVTGAILYFNHRFCEIWGLEQLEEKIRDGALSGNDLVSLAILRVVQETAFASSCAALQSTSNYDIVEDEVAFKDGRIIRRFSTRIRSEGERFQARLYVFEDVTERRRAEETLRRRVAELAALQATMLDITASHDLPTLLRIIVERAAFLLNAEGGGLYLCDPEKHQVRNVISYNTGEDYVGVTLKYGEGAAGLVAQTGQPLNIRDYRTWPGRATVYEARNPFGAVLSAPMIWQGQVTGVVHVLNFAEGEEFEDRDLELLTLFANHAAIAVENARLLAQIREQAQQVGKIMDSVPDGVVLLDAEQHVVLANPAAREYLHVLTGELQAESLARLGGKPLNALLAAHAKGIWHEIETVTAIPPRVFQVSAQPLDEQEQRRGWVLVIRDVTDEKKVQERAKQQERLAAVGQLAAGIAHDFNNLLTGIIGFGEFLRMDSNLSPQAHKDVQAIIDQGRRGAYLINQILDFSRKSISMQHSFDLLPFLKEIVKFLQRTIQENIQVSLVIEPADYVVCADPTQIQQMLTNLVLNSRDAMPIGGKLTIQVCKFAVSSPGDAPLLEMATPERGRKEWISIAISDTGTGMSSEVFAHLYEPFFTTKPVGQGTGLGLAQVYGIVKQHGGHINITSQPGQGTNVTIYLPAASGASWSRPLSVEGEIPWGGGETILLVEDEATVLEVGAILLQSLGYQIIKAPDGKSALNLYSAHREQINLVISDVIMPGIGGVELYQALKQQNPAINVILASGYPLGDEADRLLQLGIADWIQKPFDTETLARTIYRALHRQTE